MEKTKCVRVFIFLQGEENNKLWFSSKQNKLFSICFQENCFSAILHVPWMIPVGILGSSTFSLVAGKMCLPARGLLRSGNWAWGTHCTHLKGSQRTRRSRVRVSTSCEGSWTGAQWGWLHGPEDAAVPYSCPCPWSRCGGWAFCRKMV